MQKFYISGSNYDAARDNINRDLEHGYKVVMLVGSEKSGFAIVVEKEGKDEEA